MNAESIDSRLEYGPLGRASSGGAAHMETTEIPIGAINEQDTYSPQ